MEAYNTFQEIKDLPPRKHELEDCFKRHPEIPREVVVKEDVLRLGVTFSPAAVEAAKNSRVKAYSLFTYDMSKFDEQKGDEPLKVPEEIGLKGGPYDLRFMCVRTRIRADTPYLIDVVEGKTVLRAAGKVLAEVEYPPCPDYYYRTFEDGTQYYEVVCMLLWGHTASLTAFKGCQFWGENQQCKFCDINENARQLRQAGRPGMAAPVKRLEQAVKVMEAIFKEEKPPEQRPTSLVVTGGSILSRLQGFQEDDFYVQYIESITNAIGRRWPVLVAVTAPTKDMALRYLEAGGSVIQGNLEVWDERMFKILCPGKEQAFGQDELIKRSLDCVDLFGEGNVCPNFVAGVEMAQPWGFKDAQEAIRSTAEGWDFLMSHGVIPSYVNWCIEPYSALAGHPPVPLEYYVGVDQAWYETWKKYYLPPPSGFGPMGPGRALWPGSAFLDVGS